MSAALVIHTPCCSAAVSTWKYSTAHFLSLSTRLHEIFSCAIASNLPLIFHIKIFQLWIILFTISTIVVIEAF